MRPILILACLLAACDTPNPTMIGAERHEVMLQGLRFVVFRKGSEAEVLRMGYLRRSERAPVQGMMIEAVERATGCAVIAGSLRTRIPGDTGEAMVDLDC